MSDFENPWGPSRSSKPRSSKTYKQPFDEFFKNFQGPQNPLILGFVLLIVVAVLWLASGFYRVKEGELGVVLRFGKVSQVAPPGLNYHFPYPIERVIIKRVSVYNKIDGSIGEKHGLILTGDENMIAVNYIILWKIKDVVEYLFTARHPEQTITVAAESAIREIIGQTIARLALTEGRETIGLQAQELLQSLMNSYKMGVQIVSMQLQKVEAPSEVIQAFNDLQASLTDGDRFRNEAQAYEMDIIPRARGEATKIIQDAEGYQKQVVATAEGESARFEAVWAAYKQNPNVTKQKLYNEMIDHVLLKANKTILDSKVSQGLLPHLDVMKQKGQIP